MARQCWDEARHCEISVSLDHMDKRVNSLRMDSVRSSLQPDPVLRLTGVNRALEGLAIDVFNTMKSSETSW